MLPRIPFVTNVAMNKKEQTFVKQYIRQEIVPTITGLLLVTALISLTHYGYLDIKTGAPLDTPIDRLIFAARHQSLHLATIVLCIFLVISYRLGTPAMDPTHTEWERKVLEAKNVLTNTIEHGLVMIGTTLLTAIDLSPQQCARFIPIMTGAYVIGRAFFVLGYPHKRITGVLICHSLLIPSVCFNVYKLALMYFEEIIIRL